MGSIPFGLPCIAMTRKSKDIHMKAKYVERINEKICRIMRHPSEYVDITADLNTDSSEKKNW